MNEIKHTPGPWRYWVRKDGSIGLSIGDPNRGPHYQGDLCASENDARLIAAAPDLLELLKTISQSDSGFDDVRATWWEKRAAVIAKAEGRE